jgi:hypothetical protein
MFFTFDVHGSYRQLAPSEPPGTARNRQVLPPGTARFPPGTARFYRQEPPGPTARNRQVYRQEPPGFRQEPPGSTARNRQVYRQVCRQEPPGTARFYRQVYRQEPPGTARIYRQEPPGTARCIPSCHDYRQVCRRVYNDGPPRTVKYNLDATETQICNQNAT